MAGDRHTDDHEDEHQGDVGVGHMAPEREQQRRHGEGRYEPGRDCRAGAPEPAEGVHDYA
jgi:hypothetical protein